MRTNFLAALAAGLLVAGSAAVATTAGAQGGTPITAAKRAAGGAAAKANAHTAAVSGGAVETPAKPAAKPTAKPATPAASKPAAKPASKPAATKPAATKPAATKPAATTSASKPAATKPAASKSAAPDSQARTIKPGVQQESGSTSVSQRGAAGELAFQREVYSYPGQGRRDPFLSLLKSGDLRPMLTDLKLVTVLYDPTGRNSVAILRDLSTKDQYRVKVGQQLGRMRVAQIQPKQLVLTIEEFGYSRQETLSLTDNTTERTR